MLADILSKDADWPWYVCVAAKELDQPVVCTVREVELCFIRVAWRTVSKALLKLRERTITYGLVVSMFVTMYKRDITTEVKEPVGRTAC